MKVRYIGESFGIDSLTGGNVYECLAIEGIDGEFLRIVDDSGEDYLYSAKMPSSMTEVDKFGYWEIVEDTEDGVLRKALALRAVAI